MQHCNEKMTMNRKQHANFSGFATIVVIFVTCHCVKEMFYAVFSIHGKEKSLVSKVYTILMDFSLEKCQLLCARLFL